MTFKDFTVKSGNTFNLSTGTFTVPVSGIYEFTFSGYSAAGTSCGVEVYKNGNVNIHGFYISNDSSNYDSKKLESSWTVTLNAGDTMRLKVRTGKLFSDSFRPRVLSGKLLEVIS